MRNYLYGDVDLFNSKTNKEFVTKTLAALNQGQMLSIVDKNPAEPKFKMINYSVKSPKGQKDTIQIRDSKLRQTLEIQKQIRKLKSHINKSQGATCPSNNLSSPGENKMTFSNFAKARINEGSLSPMLSSGDVTQKNIELQEYKSLRFTREIETAEASPSKMEHARKTINQDSQIDQSPQEGNQTKPWERTQTGCNTTRNANLLQPLRESSKKNIVNIRNSMGKSQVLKLITSGTTAHLCSQKKMSPCILTSNEGLSTNCLMSQPKKSVASLRQISVNFNSNQRLGSARVQNNAFPTRMRSCKQRNQNGAKSQQTNIKSRSRVEEAVIKPSTSRINHALDLNILVRENSDNEFTNSNQNPMISNPDLLQAKFNPFLPVENRVKIQYPESSKSEMVLGDFVKFIHSDFLQEKLKHENSESNSNMIQERIKQGYVSYGNKRLLFSRHQRSKQIERQSTDDEKRVKDELLKQGRATGSKWQEESVSQPSKEYLQSYVSNTSRSQLVQPQGLKKIKNEMRNQSKRQEQLSVFSPIISRDSLVRDFAVSNRLATFLAKNKIPVADQTTQNKAERLKYVICLDDEESKNTDQNPNEKILRKLSKEKDANSKCPVTVSPSGSYTLAPNTAGESVEIEIKPPSQPSSIIIRRHGSIAQKSITNKDLIETAFILKQPVASKPLFFGEHAIRNTIVTQKDLSPKMGSVDQNNQTLIGLISSPTAEMIGDSPRIHDGASNQMINLLHICNASAMEVDNGVNGMQSSHDGINALVPQIQYSDANYIGASVRKEQVSQSYNTKLLNQNSQSSNEQLLGPTVQRIEPIGPDKRRTQILKQFSDRQLSRIVQEANHRIDSFPMAMDLLSSKAKGKSRKRINVGRPNNSKEPAANLR